MCSVRAHLKWLAELDHCSSLLLKFTAQVYCSSLPVNITPQTEFSNDMFMHWVSHLQVYCQSPSSLLPLPKSSSSLLAESLSSLLPESPSSLWPESPSSVPPSKWHLVDKHKMISYFEVKYSCMHAVTKSRAHPSLVPDQSHLQVYCQSHLQVYPQSDI